MNVYHFGTTLINTRILTRSPLWSHRPEVKAPLGAPLKIGEACGFHSFKASNYRLHFFESPSGETSVTSAVSFET